MDKDFQELVKKGKKTQQEVDSMIQLANEVQYAVLTRKLQFAMPTTVIMVSPPGLVLVASLLPCSLVRP